MLMREKNASNVVRRFLANDSGRDFVVGDIHGHFSFLNDLLKLVGFDPKTDRLFAVGDLVDRGPESERVIDWLKKPWFFSVIGNHEQMIIDCLCGVGDIARHTRNGGEWFYKLSDAAKLEVVTALKKLPMIIELELSSGETVGIVHAEAPLLIQSDHWRQGVAALMGEFGKDAFELATKIALYSRSKFERQDVSFVVGIVSLYVGHTTVPKVTRLGNVIYIDTGCSFSDGVLSIVDVNSGLVTATG